MNSHLKISFSLGVSFRFLLGGGFVQKKQDGCTKMNLKFLHFGTNHLQLYILSRIYYSHNIISSEVLPNNRPYNNLLLIILFRNSENWVSIHVHNILNACNYHLLLRISLEY